MIGLVVRDAGTLVFTQTFHICIPGLTHKLLETGKTECDFNFLKTFLKLRQTWCLFVFFFKDLFESLFYLLACLVKF